MKKKEQINNKKRFSLGYLILLISIVLITSACTMQKDSIATLQLDNPIISMMESGTIHATFQLSEDIKPEEITWTYGDKPLAEWKKWSEGEHKGNPFITISPVIVNDDIASVEISYEPVYDYAQTVVQYPFYKELMGTYNLTAYANEKVIAKAPVKLTPYESYIDYENLKSEIDIITAKANKLNQRFIETRSIGKSVEGRDIYLSIVAKDKETIDKYENEIHPAMMHTPELLQQKIQSGELTDYKVPIWINNIHPNESPGVSAILELFRATALEEEIPFIPNKEQENTVSMNVDKLLENVFFILVYTDNPDGLHNGTRTNADGFDLNRDNMYQTQIETQAVAAEIAKWSPITLLDFHGFDTGFLIEPAMPPHDPNVEIDLIMEHMVEQATMMGDAGTAHTTYTDYYIPYVEYQKSLKDKNYISEGMSVNTSWDDLSASYTATFAMHHGAMGFTLEVPEFREESTQALFYSGIAAANYISEHKEALFLNQLEIYRRGIENIDNRAVDAYLVNANNEIVGRERKGYENFFPEYYAIPIDKTIQKNPLEAYRMIQYFIRNGIQVECLIQDVTVGQITYPKDTFIINMHQAKRMFANTVLYDNIDVSDFSTTSAEFIQNFHDLRGFNRYEIREVGVFNGKTESVTQVEIPTTTIPYKTGPILIKNSNNDAIKVVNHLLNNGKEVIMLTEDNETYSIGDFVVRAEDLEPICLTYFLELEEVTDEKFKGKPLKPMIIMAYGETTYTLEKLGFKVTDNPDDADVLINIWDSENYVKEGKPYIAFGSNGLANVKLMLPEFEYQGPEWEQYEGVFLTELEQDHVITAPYEQEEYLYTLSGSYITNVPENAKILARFSNQKNFFKAGWWPEHDNAKGTILAFKYKDDTKTMTVFANDLIANGHSQHQYRLLANAIFDIV